MKKQLIVDGTPYPKTDCPGLRVFTEEKDIKISDEIFFKKDGQKSL